ncbi:hypothetical protein KBC79_00695 [Candidatus Woesebacteria bacterium]|nr:hypothetical protein [Candidatus Woesebacteria bacterium]
MKQKKTRAHKVQVNAKWVSGQFSLETSPEHHTQSENLPEPSGSVIFDKNQVRLLYKDIRTSLIASACVFVLLAIAYAMMRF